MTKKVLVSVLTAIVLLFSVCFAEATEEAAEEGKSIWSTIGGWFSDAVTDVVDWTTSAASDTWDWISRAASDVWDWTSGAANNTGEWVAGTATGVWNGVSDFFSPPPTEGNPSIPPEPILPDGTLKMYLGYKAVETGKDNGYSNTLEMTKNDPHFGLTLGKFYVSGYTMAVPNEDKNFVFLKNVGDNVELHFELVQDINMIGGNTLVTINSDFNAYDREMGVPPTDFGRGTLIVRFTDYQNNTGEPQVYTDYLAAKMTGTADTVISLNEEGDYEISLDYEIKENHRVLGMGLETNTITNYKIKFKFEVRNGNCMVFPFDLATGAEIKNTSIAENGFRLDMAYSRYLQMNVRYSVLTEGTAGIVEDVRFNRPARDGEAYTKEGIYTIAARNKYTGEETIKRLYVGHDEKMILPYTNSNEQRQKEVLFSNNALANEEYYITVNSASLNDISSLNKCSIATIDGADFNEMLTDYLKEHNLEVELKYYPQIDNVWDALRNGETDAAIYTSLTYSKDGWNCICMFGEKSTYIAVSKNRLDLLETLDEASNLVEQEKPSFLGDLYEKYFPDNPMRNSLTMEEQSWVDSHSVIRIGGFKNDAPYIFSYDEANQTASGLTVDLVDGIIDLLNLNVETKYICYESLPEMENALDAGEIDAIIPFYPDYSIAEQHNLIISNVARVSNMELIYKRGTTYDEAFRKIATPETKLGIFYVSDHFPECDIVGSKSIRDAVEKVISGEATGAIAQNVELHRIKEEYDNLDYYVLPDGCGTCFATRPQNYPLIRVLNRGLNYFSSAEVSAIASKYSYSNLQPYTLTEFLRDNVLWIIAIILVVSSVFIIMIRKNAKRVSQALEEVKNANDANELVLSFINGIKWSYFINDKDEVISVKYGESAMVLYDADHPGEPLAWMKLLHPDDRDRAIDDFMDTIRDHSCTKVCDITYRLMGTDGCYHWTKVAARVFPRENGIRELCGISVDVSDQMDIERQQQKLLADARVAADAANQSKSNFLFNMSHDIRTPMNAIRGFTTMARKNADDREKVIGYLDKIDISGQQLLTLINQVLEMARIESGKIEFEEKPVNVRNEFNSMVTVLSEQAKSNGLKFIHALGNIEHDNILADEARMSSITLNIVGNAMKYTPEGGTVEYGLREIEARKPGYATFVFTVADTGIGMSEEYLKELYEPFSREKSSTVSKIQGTGLGMSIVKSTIDLMGGNIEVQSTLGEGTRFDITVDFRIDENADQSTEENDDISLVSFKGRRMLLVEDNEMNREIAKDILEEQGIIVEDADDGDVAVAMVKAVVERGEFHYYDFILMDVQMPRMNGYEATKAIRAIPGPDGVHIPIIAMTANAFEEDRQNALAAGMDEHLAKPIDVNKAFRTIAKFLK